MTRQERSWILYDVANSAFVLVVVTAVMPLFFKDYAAAGLPPAISTAHWGFANSAAALAVAIAAPVLGAMADAPGMKKRFFAGFLAMGILATFLLPTVSKGAWLWCLLLYAIAKAGFAGSNLFYDAFLPDVTEPERMDRLSASGFAWGYLGSVVPFLAVVALLLAGGAGRPGAGLPPEATRLGFVVVGCWWLLFSIPMLRHVRQRHAVEPDRHPIRAALARIVTTFREARRHRWAFQFLLAYFFYIDGVDTIIIMATAYGSDIGLGPTTLLGAILMIQVVAFPFSLLFGRLADRFDAVRLILGGIGIYGVITCTAVLLPSVADSDAKKNLFWLLAFLVATSMGGIQALSRSCFGRLIPASRSAEFFGLYNICGRFATVTGPFLMGLATRLSGESRYGVLSILLLFIVGGVLLIPFLRGGAGLHGQTVPGDRGQRGDQS